MEFNPVGMCYSVDILLITSHRYYQYIYLNDKYLLIIQRLFRSTCP